MPINRPPSSLADVVLEGLDHFASLDEVRVGSGSIARYLAGGSDAASSTRSKLGQAYRQVAEAALEDLADLGLVEKHHGYYTRRIR
jgi:ribosomal protein S19E (S16A)